MHKGHTAGGPWGMMPKTVAYVLGLSKSLRTKYPDLTEKSKDVGKNHQYFTKTLNTNPEAALDLAKTLYNHLHTLHKGDINKTVHSWHYGIGGTNNAVKNKEDLNNNEYVMQFKNASGTKSKTVIAENNPAMNKAFTAGYGGAGAPTGRVSGNVFQAESLEDDGRSKVKGFQYITCDKCGSEVIFVRHQCKCRDCGKAFSLKTLYDAMSRNKN
jgi:hypothetical protein